MSRFSEICESYSNLLNSAKKYEEDCQFLLKTIVNGFTKFLECNNNDINIKNIELKEDGYYHCSIEINVYSDINDKYSTKGNVPDITIKLGRDRELFILKLLNGKKVFTFVDNDLNNIESNKLVEFYEYIFSGIKSYYETPVEDFVHKNMNGLIYFV